jgi:hypothetical protein
MNAVLQTHSQKALTSSVDAYNATLADLRDTITVVLETNELEKIMIQHNDLSSTSLFQATALFPNQLMNMSRRRIAGRRGYGDLHSTIMAEDDWSTAIPVTRVRDGKLEDAVAQNVTQLDTASKGRKRKFGANNDETIPLVNYGIVIDARKWYFVECTSDPASEATPTFCTSQLPGRIISYSENEAKWQEDVRRIFKHVVSLADKVGGRIDSNRQKRARK